MPDWSYQTVFRPLLFRLRPQTARRLALGGMGALARLPLGRGVIQLMGHMQPDARLAIERSGICFPSSVGLGCRLDPYLLGSPALAEFGFGFLEIGPIVADPPSEPGELRMDAADESIRSGQVAGIVVGDEPGADAALRIGKANPQASLQTVRDMREQLGSDPIIISSAGVHSPADALDYVEAGADLVQVDSGLIFAGPGLPKRINAALLYRRQMTEGEPAETPVRFGGQAWFWALMMGLSMLIGGTLAMLIATTRVVMPYDESMAGLTRQQLVAVNDRLLSFMTHDRVTLAGTMLAVGILYSGLAWHGIRRGVHWAFVTVVASALAGFVSFFSFLGFGYFDPFHAFVTAILFQFLALTVHSVLPPPQRQPPPELWNDRRWRANQWGQLLFVVQGAILIVAGLVISGVGMTSVFVPEDLEFMNVCTADLVDAHPQLVPLVAHDRATFGGMLIACGVATLLPALWGFQRGQAWLWRALMAAGNIAYCSTILVHWAVGYHSLKHLLPAYGGWALLWAGGAASHAFLVARDPELEAEWTRRLERT